MTTAYKTLGQLNPAATTLTTLYTVGASTQTVVSKLMVCNQGASGSYRIAVRPAGAAIDPKHYVGFDLPLNGNDAVPFPLEGLSLATTDVVSVYASHANFSFNLSGAEIT